MTADLGSIRDQQLIEEADFQAIHDRVVAIFRNRGVDPSVHLDGSTVDPAERLRRIASEIQEGQRDFRSVRQAVERQVAQAGDDTETPTDPAEPEPIDDPTPRDFRAEAKALYPWLPDALLNVFANAWDETDSPALALSEVRQSPEYDRVFAGNKRPDGSLRYSEQGYFAAQQGFRSALSEFGLDSSRELTGLFEREVSVNEFARGVASAHELFRRPGGRQPTDLLNSFVDAMTNTGSTQAALDTVRDTAEYERTFRGIRREDGSLRMNEQEYFAALDGYARELSQFGLNPRVFQDRFVDAIEGELSVDEFASRLSAADEQLVGNVDEVRRFYTDNYGIAMTDEAILGSFIDPNIGRGVLERRIAVSQIGGEAAAAGFQRSLARAEELAAAGVGQQQARQLYRSAGEQVPLMQQLAARHHDPNDPFTIDDFERAGFLGDADVRRRMQRRVQEEQASFTGARVARDEAGGLAGLRRR